MRRTIIRPAWVLTLAVVLSAHLALTAANVVTESKADLYSTIGSPNGVKPVDCSSIIVSSLFKGAADVTGGPDNDLVLGGSASQTLSGAGGNDCILGGAGDDTLQGGAGSEDVCIGGPGEDTFIDCETTVQGDPTF